MHNWEWYRRLEVEQAVQFRVAFNKMLGYKINYTADSNWSTTKHISVNGGANG